MNLLFAVRWVLFASLLFTTGCVRQMLIVKTEPPGANVFYNGVPVGQTPLMHEFLWYEPYQLRVEKEGQPTLQQNGILKAPPWMWFPIDGIMAVLPLPLKDRHYVSFDFAHPQPEQIAAAQESLEHPSVPHTGVLDDLRRIHQSR